ncbi:hypothetical protein [Streptomyces bungoensis]|uniref:hypothetical protein n=1 Tax=Streptomyces bungoensis TaxID=285568 RepID=UPI000A689D5B|nr:hypothetical protein [Streptomyces bungoensis]
MGRYRHARTDGCVSQQFVARRPAVRHSCGDGDDRPAGFRFRLAGHAGGISDAQYLAERQCRCHSGRDGAGQGDGKVLDT